jgi:cell division protein FtsZ
MLFVTAGMGGGTGTGAAPVIATIAKEMGILTVAIVTLPFSWEGRKKSEQALNGIKELKKNVDTLLLICNDKLREFFGNLTMSNAFSKADDVLKIAAKGISDIVNRVGKVNVDFEDVNTVIRNSGVAIMGSGVAEGENRAVQAIEQALSSPLLNDNNITGASNILLYITSGREEITMDEFESITQHIQNETGSTAEIIWGISHDESLENKIAITIVATGFDYNELTGGIDIKAKPVTRKILPLIEDIIIQNPSPVAETLDDEEMQVRNKFLRKDEKPANEKKKEIIKDLLDFENIAMKFNNMPVDEEITLKSERAEKTENIENIEKIEKSEAPVAPEPEKAPDSVITSNSDIINEIRNSVPVNDSIEKEVMQSAKEQRNKRLKEMSEKLKKDTHSLEQLEKEPAFRRRNVQLSNTPPASESSVSKYTLTEDDEKNVIIKPNNSFLHDNVD